MRDNGTVAYLKEGPMKDGFVKVAAVTPNVRVADVSSNVDFILDSVYAACEDAGAKLIVCPELCVTGYTCGDLFFQSTLIRAAEAGVATIAERTAQLDALIFVGAPVAVSNKLYDCAVAIAGGSVLGVVPKQNIPGHNEFNEGRHFAAGPAEVSPIDFAGQLDVPFGANQLFACEALPELVVAAELSEDLFVVNPPSARHALAGATVICNLSALSALVGKAASRRTLVLAHSARLHAAYLFAGAGWGESTTDLVFAGQGLVAENGRLLVESPAFDAVPVETEIDVQLLAAERRRVSTFAHAAAPGTEGYVVNYFMLEQTEVGLTRTVDAMPFVPDTMDERAERCEEIFSIQAFGLAKRLEHTHTAKALIGVSGGLDSTLALLVTVRAFDLLGLDRKGIIAITMPGFGTTSRTKSNAMQLCEALGCELREISIAAAVRQHFADIGQAEDNHDVTYENAQARERTQILMDVANQVGGMVIGTGDLSELALGWATYNGDHMSNYCVNGGVPKTLVRHLVRYVADTCENDEESRVLLDVLATPVSPELLPASEDGTIAQKTEDLVGPYELHDFFLYEVLRRGSSPSKIYRLARHAWGHAYDDVTILAWLKVFYRRFFAQQFKRSCLPDGPAVGSVGVSPRGGLCMPSDAASALWLEELETL